MVTLAVSRSSFLIFDHFMAFGLPQARAGLRDRQIFILSHTVTINDLGEPVETFEPGGKAWAHVVYKSVVEGDEAGSKRASKTICFKIGYRTDISEADRVEFDNRDYQIIGITELGRRELLEIETFRIEGQTE